MKKFSWSKFLNISMAVIGVLVLGCVLYLSCFYKPKDSGVKAQELVSGVPFKVGVMERNASSMRNDHYVYTTEAGVYTGNLEYVSNGNYVMLPNYHSEQLLQPGMSNIAGIKNIYISFGSENDGIILSSLNVSLKINGVTTRINNTFNYETDKLPENITTARYWYGYFDGKAETSTSGETISGEGLYEFQFDYSYGKDGRIYTGYTYTYSFYLLDQNKYDIYPKFAVAEQGQNDSTKIPQYYYNYTKDSLPTLTFDASKYNISYTKEKNKDVETVTTSFAVNATSQLGTLTINSTINGKTTTDTISNIEEVDGAYNVTLEFDELGTYTFDIKYLVKVSDGINTQYNIVDNISAYDLKDLDADGNNKYENGTLQKGKLKLHLFGIKAYFSKNGQTELKYENVKADVTSKLYDETNKSYDKITTKFMENSVLAGYEYPKTNVPPITFDYYGSFVYDGYQPESTYRIYSDSSFKTEKGQGYITKDTSLDASGYYEVIITYTYDFYSTLDKSQADGKLIKHKQAFVFQIHNSTPSIELTTIDDDTPVRNNSFVNTGVKANWVDATYFEAPLSATYTKYDFNNNLLVNNQPITKNSLIGDGGNGKYEVKIHLNKNTGSSQYDDSIYVGYGFTIDKDPISNISISPIYARKNITTNSIIGYALSNDRSEVNFGNSNIINQPFTLTYSKKASGAAITTIYYKIPFSANPNVGNVLNNGADMLIETNYLIDANNIDGGSPFNFDYTTLTNGIVSSENAFVDNISNIYIFEMYDEAGNTASKYVIYDLTKPYVVVDSNANTPEIDPIDNPYGIVTKEAKITWGNYKAIKVKADVTQGNISNKRLQDIISNESAFDLINNTYYLNIPITKVDFKQGSNSISLTNRTDVNIYPMTKTGSEIERFFSGDDKTYTYQISDASNIQSLTNISNSSVTKGFVRMFLDNAQGIAYAYFKDPSQISPEATDGFEDILSGTSSAQQLKFTYLPGEEGSAYHVKNVTYTFYDFAPSEYMEVNTIIDSRSEELYLDRYTTMTENGVPYPTYPFNKIASITDKALTASSGKRGTQDCMWTGIINPISESGTQKTKPGMYVIKREYEQLDGGDYTYDSIIRYYTYIVDRTGIIEIDTSIEDTNIYQYSGSQPEMLYETGSGILLNFSNTNTSGLYETYYTALQIQQYLNYAQSSDAVIVNTNKLPINLNIPNDKYNSRYTLAKSKNSSNVSSYITSTYNSNRTGFGLRYTITTIKGDEERLIFDNTDGNVVYNSTYITMSEANGVKNFRIIKEGTYTIQLYDTSDSRSSQLTDSAEDISRQYNNKYKFVFTITHESPSGEFYSKYNDTDRTDMILEAENVDTSGTTNTQTFYSTNNDSLRFRFRKNDDKYKAEIDPSNIRIEKRIGNSTTTIFNGSSTDSEVLQFVPDTVGASTGYYVITIFDEYEYQHNGKTYIGGSGNNRDYLLAKQYNIQYIVTLQYVGTESDYIVNDGSTTKNFYKSIFYITLDRIKPQYNYQALVNLDNQKYNAKNTLTDSKMDNYFFAINDNFEFKQNITSGGVLDSSKIYIRKLAGKSADCEYPDYYKTFTPDDDNYYEDGNSNHIRFSDSDSTFISDIGYSISSDSTVDPTLSARDLFGAYGAGYYEVIERDEAGNYTVYGIFYNPDSTPNIVNYSYNPKLQTDRTDAGTLPDTTTGENVNSIELLGNNLQFTSITASTDAFNDYFYKCVIQSGTNTTTITNNPNDRNDSNSWSNFIKQVNDALAFTNTVTKAGHKVIITFVNRLSENYTITYRVPGDRLEPIFRDVTSSQFTITIPNDNDSTYIKEFHVWKFTNGTWVEQSQDSLGNTIIKSYSTGASLQGRTYTFGLGEFKFQLIDIFDRGLDQKVYPPYYKGMGVNDVRTINYGTSITDNNIVNTANNVTLNYQTNLYLLSIYVGDENGKNFTLINETNYADNGIIEQSLINGVRTLLFQNNYKNTIRTFKVELVVEKTNTLYTYTFAINKTLPEIELRNQSGGKLISSGDQINPTIHTENFYISWDSNYKFDAKVSLIRTYTDTVGKQQVENINNIINGYEVNLPGTYSASIRNSLGYYDNSLNIYFKLVSGEIVVYDVVQINDGIETVLRPSPKTTTYTDPETGSIKLLYSYFALNDYNNPTGSDKYIEIRANKNKGIEYELIYSTIDDEEIALKKKIYKIVGKSNYGYERYIQIVFVDKVADTDGLTFTNITALYPSDDIGTMTSLPLSSDVKTNVNKLELSWKAYNTTKNNYSELRGNLIYADYYFNGKFIKTIYDDSSETNSLTLTTAGIHKLKLYDLAGNYQIFGGTNEMTINLVNNVLFTINDEEPVANRIFNGDVTLQITNRYLYYTDPTITATMNGVAFTPDRVGTSYYEYKFSNHGYYEITISTKITQNESVTTKYCFTIINPNIALPCFSVPQNSNFTIIQVLKQNSDITHTLENLNELWISPESLGTGNYTITLSQYNETLGKDVEFSFQVWVNNEIPYVYSSIPFGTGSTKQITITYNPKIIYDQIGVGYIAISGMPSISINADSPNEITTLTLTQNREYWIQIFSADNKLINSYKVTKNEPLNTTSIIIIVVSSVVVVALIVVFIVIRRHLKFR